MLDPGSRSLLAISDLFNLCLAIGAVILALVTGLVVYISFRFRGRPGDDEPPQVHGHTRLEILWTAGPLLIVGALFVLTVLTLGKADPTEQPSLRAADVAAGLQKEPSADIIVVGHQWWWEVIYPKAGVATANEIHLPAGKPMLVRLDSADVVHDLWILKVSRKVDMVPGSYNYITLEADTPGVYQGACAEFCGVEHAWMLISSIVQPQGTFDAWVAHQNQKAAPFPSASAATPTVQAAPANRPPLGNPVRGAALFQQRTCISCHAINGATTNNATAGPNLTHFASRSVIGAGVLTNTPENLALWIANPQKVKPGSYMPNFLLPAQEVQDLVSYLETLK